MFASLTAQIRLLPPWGQAIAWPLFGMLWLVCQITMGFLQALGWMFKEMFGQAKAGAKKTFAPLLWPVVGVLVLAAVAASIGPQGMQMLFVPIIGIGVMLFGLRVMVSGVWPMSKKPSGKKKKH
ncbi:MAG: hypothetical protein WCI89_03405 [bacterium]